MGFFLKKYYYRFELEKGLKDCSSLLDVGCGADSPIKYFSKRPYSVGVDAFIPYLRDSQRKDIHNEYVQMDILNIGAAFSGKSFDAVLASDVIEHLKREDGLRLLQMMESIARKKVIVFTPNGFLPQEIYDGNVHQLHLSGWEVDEMRHLGFKVIGLNGWKALRDNGRLKFWPERLWTKVSSLSQIFVRNHPDKAFQILCVKDLRD